MPASYHLINHLRVQVVAWGSDPRADAELLRQFAAGDQTAFAVLVGRYGRFVWRVSVRGVGSPHDAEEVFQATFLTLARKAATLTPRSHLCGWLRGVAERFACDLRRRAARRARQEQEAARSRPVEEVKREPDDWEAVDAELARLPAQYREPVERCYLSGQTYAQAASELGCSVAAVQRRVGQALELLRRRLRRRGVAATAGSVTAALTARPGGLAAALPGGLVARTVGAAAAVVRGEVPATPAAHLALRYGVRPVPWPGVAAVAAALLVAGGLAWVASAPTADPARAAPEPPKLAAAQDDGRAGRRVELTGWVLDPAGRAVPGAQVTALASPLPRPGERAPSDQLLGVTRPDAAGRFRLTVPADFPSWDPARHVRLLVTKPGGGSTVLRVTLARHPSNLKIVLTPVKEAAGGQLVDEAGRPAAGVRVEVVRFGGVRWEPTPGQDPPPGWPVGAVTDAQGRFTLADLDAGRSAVVRVNDPRYAAHAWELEGFLPAAGEAEVRKCLEPARLLAGRVLAAGERPLPLARVSITAEDADPDDGVSLAADVLAGPDGRYQVRLPPGRRFRVRAFAPEGEPFLPVLHAVPELAPVELDLALPPAEVVTVRVADARTGRAVSGAHARFVPARDARLPEHVLTGPETLTPADPAGVLRVPVPAVPGQLLVHLPADSGYVARPYDWGELRGGDPDGRRLYAHAAVRLDPPAAGDREVAVTVEPGVTLVGRAVAPDGRPVRTGSLLCRAHASPVHIPAMVRVPIHNGEFRLTGCDPARTYPVLLLDPGTQSGAVAELKAGCDAGGVTVRLRACGSAVVRLVDECGRPLARAGPTRLMAQLGADGEDEVTTTDDPERDGVRMHYFDPSNPRTKTTDAAGRLALSGLVPGVTYRVYHYREEEGLRRVFSTAFVPVPGRRLELPDLVIRSGTRLQDD